VLKEAVVQMDRLDAVCGDLEVRALLGGRFDANNCYLDLHAGAGGTESCDWADMLFRMFKRYAERNDSRWRCWTRSRARRPG
jgi:peptide chain release factor 2